MSRSTTWSPPGGSTSSTASCASAVSASRWRSGPSGCHRRWPLARQHYRLQYWRLPARNVRRFFTIDDLVAVRVEHAEVRRGRRHGAAPARRPPRRSPASASTTSTAWPIRSATSTGLREVIGDRWLLVEKILAAGERLPASWPVDGTTGYEHATLARARPARPPRAGQRWPTRWATATGDDRPFRSWELDARLEVLDRGLRPDLERVARVAGRAVDSDPADDRRPRSSS